jgi:uncharacterized phage-like protein YoqJ
MDCAKNITVAFSGHRTYAGEACDELREVVFRLYNEGYRRFLCGMAWGFDLAAGEVVAELKRVHTDVELVAVVPYEGFYRLFHAEDAEQYRRVADAADEVIVVSEDESKVAYRLRNDYLVENSSIVVAWFNGVPRGGTAYTLRQARRKGVLVENIFHSAQLSLEF